MTQSKLPDTATPQAGVVVSADNGQKELPGPVSKTPLFEAMHASRYLRQTLIKRIQERTGHELICYVAGNEAMIDHDDTLGFVDLLHNVKREHPVDLLLHTIGGDVDAAEKLITMVRMHVGKALLRVVVPDFAKSAGTLMALGADTIIMGDSSELGPIDPQIMLADVNGNRIRHSVHSYLDAYKEHAATLTDDPEDVPAKIMLSKLDPATVKLFQSVSNRARTLAEGLLKQGMHRDGKGNWSTAAESLLDNSQWQSHGQMISWRDAQDAKIGLSVEHLDSGSELWRDYWQLHCLQRLEVRSQQRLYESRYVSLIL